jgi:L-2-amino-thiazoline-4-carboxylic acid hydrolase
MPSSAKEVLDMSANRAFRYVFTRTLPLRSQPELVGDSAVACAVSEVEAGTLRVVEAHLHRAVDDRAAVHLHTAALAIATHRVLIARIRDSSRVMNMLRGAFGAGADVEADAKLPGYWVGKAGLMFTFDRMAGVRRMTSNAMSDFGKAFVIARTDDEAASEHRLTVSTCLYADICRQEGVPGLTGIFCSLDRALFSYVSPSAHGIEFSMSRETLADGKDHPCEFQFTKANGSKE